MSKRASVLLSLAALLVLAPTGCDKGGTNAPGGGGSAQSEGMLLSYKPEAFKLSVSAELALEVSGAASGSAELSGKGLIELTPAGEGKLKAYSKMTEVGTVDLQGQMAPKPKEGEPAPDMKANLAKAESWSITDLRGEGDDEATKALPENVAKKAEAEKNPEGGDGGLGDQLLALPNLPKVGLVLGKEVKVEEKEDQPFFGGQTMPMEFERTYKLESIDESSGKRIAFIVSKSVGSGAKEMSGGGQTMFVSLEQETTQKLYFDLDAQIPVKVEVEFSSAIAAGEQAFEQLVEYRAEYALAQ